MADEKVKGTGEEEAFRDNYSKKDSKGYVAFRSDEDDSSDLEDDLKSPAKDRKKLKKEKSNAFKDKFKSMKVKKKEKEKIEKPKEKDKDKDKRDKKRYKRSASAGAEPLQAAIPLVAPSPVFGVSLDVAISRSRLPDGIELPRVFRECIQYIEEKGIDLEGIYRISGVKSKLDELRLKYNHGMEIDLDSYGDPHIMAGLLKLYLRDLKGNVLTAKLLPVFDSCVGLKDPAEQVECYKKLLSELPSANRTLLGWLFVHLKHVMDHPDNKMNIQNISIVFSPTMNITHGILHIFFSHVEELFPGVEIVKYVPPPKTEEHTNVEHNSIASPRTIQKQLVEEEEVLDRLHEKINKEERDEDEDLMEEIWERQRKVTQLKRKLKAIRRAEVTKPILETDDKQPIVITDASTRATVTTTDAVDGKPDDTDDNCNDIKDMLYEQKRLLYEQEEIAAVTKFLQERIEEERASIERLQEDLRRVTLAKQKRASSSSDESFTEHDSEEENRLMSVANQLKLENKQLREEGNILVNAICNERELCIQLRSKVKLVEKDNYWVA